MDYSDGKSSLYFTSSLDQALQNNISWETLEALLDELTPTLAKSKELVKILLKQLQQFHKNFQEKQIKSNSRVPVECNAKSDTHDVLTDEMVSHYNQSIEERIQREFFV